MAKYRVASGHSILVDVKSRVSGDVRGRDLDRIMSGQEIPDGLLTPQEIKNKVANGVIVPIGGEAVQQEALGGTVPGEIDLSENEGKVVLTEDNGDVKTETISKREPENNAVKQAPSPWTLNPDDLSGKSLDELQVMVLERDEDINVKEFESVEEIVAFMTQDFED